MPINRIWDKIPVYGAYMEIDDVTPKSGTVTFQLTQRVQRVDGLLIYPKDGKIVRRLGTVEAADQASFDAVRAIKRADYVTAAMAGANPPGNTTLAGAEFDAFWAATAQGRVFVRFPASDDPDIVQTGWQVLVTEALDDGTGQQYLIEPKLAMLPKGFDLGSVDVPPGSPIVPAPIYAKGYPGGVAPLDLDGKVPAANLPASSGSGAPIDDTTTSTAKVYSSDKVSTLLTAKANSSTVTSGLASKADAATVTTALAGKAALPSGEDSATDVVVKVGGQLIKSKTRRPQGHRTRLSLTALTPGQAQFTQSQTTQTTAFSDSLYGPCIVRLDDKPMPQKTVGGVLQKYGCLVSTNHDDAQGGGLWYFTAPDLAGPWTAANQNGSNKGQFVFKDATNGYQTETPWAIWNPDTEIWHVYYQQVLGGSLNQATFLALTTDFVTFDVVGRVISTDAAGEQPGDRHTGYFTGARRANGEWWGSTILGGTDNGLRAAWHSPDGITWDWDHHAMFVQAEATLLNGQRCYPTGQTFFMDGEVWSIGTTILPASGGAVVRGSLVAGPVTPDLRKWKSAPRLIAEPTSPGDALGGGYAFVDADGAVYVARQFNTTDVSIYKVEVV